VRVRYDPGRVRGVPAFLALADAVSVVEGERGVVRENGAHADHHGVDVGAEGVHAVEVPGPLMATCSRRRVESFPSALIAAFTTTCIPGVGGGDGKPVSLHRALAGCIAPARPSAPSTLHTVGRAPARGNSLSRAAPLQDA